MSQREKERLLRTLQPGQQRIAADQLRMSEPTVRSTMPANRVIYHRMESTRRKRASLQQGRQNAVRAQEST